MMKGVEILDCPTFQDKRGYYLNLYTQHHSYTTAYPHFNPNKWLEDDVSVSQRGVLRGIHGDDRTDKLVKCVFGSCFFVVVNPETKKFMTMELNGNDEKTLFISKGLGIGFYVRSDWMVWYYKQSQVYQGSDKQFTIKWDDPAYNIHWPVKYGEDPLIVSERDE